MKIACTVALRHSLYSLLILIFFCNLAQAVRENFPEGGDAPYNRFAVFIGIDHYPNLKNGNLDGCVNDVQKLKELFVQRFGFQRYAMLTNAAATRQGIGDTFKSLIKQVKFGKAQTKDKISVLICYAGHGSQVKDQDGDEADGKDETWVAHDSSWDGENDIRDDELQTLYRQLTKLDAQVVLISDSCHSGSLHRSGVKVRRVNRKKLALGPQDDLFPGLKTRGNQNENEPLSGFVAYTACLDTQFASEYKDDDGNPCGRFTYILRQLLPTIAPQTSYQDFYEKISLEFSKRGFARTQMPQFHASYGKVHEPFLEGGAKAVPIYAEIRPGTQRGRKVKLTMGELHGVTKESIFIFYPTLADLRNEENELVRGTAKIVSSLTSTVVLAKKGKLPSTAKAKLVRVQMTDYVVYPGENLPDAIRAKLEGLATSKQLSLDKEGNDYTVAVYYNPTEKTLGIYPPQALPDVATGEGGDALRFINAEDIEKGAEMLTENLFYLARVNRLIGLAYNEEKIETEVKVYEGEMQVERPKNSGVLLLQDGDMLTLTFTNQARKPLYISIFYINPKGNIELFYPLPEDDPTPIKPGEAYELDEAGIEVDGTTDVGRSRIKVIATSEFTDFSPLIEAPTTGMDEKMRGKTRGADDPLYDMLSDVLHGSEETDQEKARAKRVRSKATWATATVVVDVKPLE